MAMVDTRTGFPVTTERVLEIIRRAERHPKYVWTAGRVLERAALWTELEQLDYRERKSVCQRVQKCLAELERDGILSRRPEIQTIGYGEEIGFDYVRDET